MPEPRLDPLDLEAIYARHHRLVRWLVHGAGIPTHAVDDVVQDVFVAIHRRRAAAPATDLRPWIVGVTRSVCHTHRRADARRQQRLAAVAAIPETAPQSAESVLDDQAALSRVRRALRTMTPSQREAFVLVELHGLAAPEAARALGANLNTVYSRVRLARRRLESAIREPARVVAAAREQGRTPPRAARRVWAAIAVEIGLPKAGVVATVGTAAAVAARSAGPVTAWLRWAGWGAAAAVPSLAAVIAASPTASADPPAARDPIAAVRIEDGDRSGGRDSGLAAPSHAAGAPHSAEVAVGQPAADGSGDPAAIAPRRANGADGTQPRRGRSDVSLSTDASANRRRAVARDPAAAPSRSPVSPVRRRSRRSKAVLPGAAARTGLRAETALLRRAARALDEGRLSAGADHLASHRNTFADGLLAAERVRLERALSRLRAQANATDRAAPT